MLNATIFQTSGRFRNLGFESIGHALYKIEIELECQKLSKLHYFL